MGTRDVRFGSQADMCSAAPRVRFTPNSDRKSGFCGRSCSSGPSDNNRSRSQSSREIFDFFKCDLNRPPADSNNHLRSSIGEIGR